ncbi:MAG: dihydropteroate synthase [Ignavibacteriales bacterium]|nr:dihydropteroate synthase [Ignavibacteriales bacterium]
MVIQIVDIFYPNVFKRYSAKFSIFRELHEKDLLALEIRGIDFKFAHKVKKIILSNKEICYTTQKNTKAQVDLLALGSYGIFKELAKEIIALGNEDLGFKIKKVVQNVTEYENKTFSVGSRSYSLDRAYVMGILNVTPDSFSDGGIYFEKAKAIEHGLQLIEDGADFLDIGGESSRPGAETIAEDEELSRIIPVIEAILKKEPDTVISVDTTKSKVAFEALARGAKLVNDISAFCFDEKMIEVVKQFDASVILMHMQGAPDTMQNNPHYEDVVPEIYDFLVERTELARKNGIKNILLDPGIGFGKRVMDNYEIIKRLNEFKGTGCPILIGLSKKSFLGSALNLGVDEREDPTLSAETIAVKNGARIIRTHNVRKAKLAVQINNFIENPDILANV